MQLGKRIAHGLVILPAAEVAVFVLVAWVICLLAAIALMVLTSVTGAIALRGTRRGRIARFRVALADSVTGIDASTGGFIFVLGGILLLLRGFITDVTGALLLVPAVRKWLGATIRRAGGLGERRGPGFVSDLKRGNGPRSPTRSCPTSDKEKEGAVAEPPAILVQCNCLC